jgi:dihydrofolate synthase/folylpolyglutamate synthase
LAAERRSEGVLISKPFISLLPQRLFVSVLSCIPASLVQQKVVLQSAVMRALDVILARTNVETLSHSVLAREQAQKQGEGARVFGLDRVRRVLHELGDPHLQYRVVHVAGSKGKGTVCECVCSGLTSAGVCAGLFTSPHVRHMRERVRVRGECVSEAELEQLAQRVLAAEEASMRTQSEQALGQCTHFELLTLMAFLHFAQQSVDVAVIEVGLGGELDATNVVQPGSRGVCVITSIQHEHVELLGPGLASIARHKAGIMKHGTVCVSAPQEAEVLRVLKSHAASVGATLCVLGENVPWSARDVGRRDAGPQRRVPSVTMRFAGSVSEDVRAPWPGMHTALNTCLALAACAQLRAGGLEFDMRACERGIEQTPARARLELVRGIMPRLVVDGAHTPESVHATLEALSSLMEFDSLITIFGCAADKNLSHMAVELAKRADKIIATQSASPRSKRAADVLRACQVAGARASCEAKSVHDAWAIARRVASPRDVVLAIGSFALVGDVLDAAGVKKQ